MILGQWGRQRFKKHTIQFLISYVIGVLFVITKIFSRRVANQVEEEGEMKEKEEEEVMEKEEELLDPEEANFQDLEEEELDESGEPEITNFQDLWSYARENLPELSVSFFFHQLFYTKFISFYLCFFIIIFCHIK